MPEKINKVYAAFSHGAAICTDTRSISKGCIFFALRGANFNGNTFASQALDHGAALVIVDEVTGIVDDRFVITDDVLLFLQRLATHHRSRLQIPVLGITGSNGKTTTKELVNRVLSQKFKTLCTKGNLNNHIGVPLTLLSINSGHQLAIIEMGANHQKEIELLCSIAQPTHVLITNVGKAHLEGFGGFDGVKKGKGEMYAFAKANNAMVFINDDNRDLNEMLNGYTDTIRYGTKHDHDITGELMQDGTYVSLKWKSKKYNEWHVINSRITGSYNFENILSAISVGSHFDVNENDITNAIASYEPDNQRSQVIEKGSNHIVLDAYNANPTSMEAALKNFSLNFKSPRAVMLGDMFELGESSHREHEAIAALVHKFKFDLVIFVGPNFKNTNAIAYAKYFETSGEAAAWVKGQPLQDCNILLKGSRGSKMEVVLEAI